MANWVDTIFLHGITFFIAYIFGAGCSFCFRFRITIPRSLEIILFPFIRSHFGYEPIWVCYIVFLYLAGIVMAVLLISGCLPRNGETLELWISLLFSSFMFFAGGTVILEAMAESQRSIGSAIWTLFSWIIGLFSMLLSIFIFVAGWPQYGL